MKIMQINCVYKKGSTGKIVYDLHTHLLDKGIDSIVCYGRGEKSREDRVYKTSGEFEAMANKLLARLTGLPYAGCIKSTSTLIKIIKKENPDIVHLHCINGYFVNIYRLVWFLKQSGKNTVLTNHADFLFTGNCGLAFDCEKWKTSCSNCPDFTYATTSRLFDTTALAWKKMKKALGGFGEKMVVTSVSPWLKNRAESSAILKEYKHFVTMNGLDTNVFYPRQTSQLRQKYSKYSNIVFHATAHFTDNPRNNKGGHEIIRLAGQLKKDNIAVIVAGQYSLTNDVPDNLIILGRLANQDELACYYSLADITVITSQRETFSMITAESLCCATPVVGYMAGGPESIAMAECTKFVPYGDFGKLYDTVVDFINNKRFTDAAVAHKIYSKEAMANRYLEVYDYLLNGGVQNK